MQIFHKLSTATRPSFFQRVDVGHIVQFSFQADPNYGFLARSEPKPYVCTVKVPWNNGDHKFNFKPLDEQKNNVHVLVTVANAETGTLHTCEIQDKGYCILEVRSPESKYYHPTTNSVINVLFEQSTEPSMSDEMTSQWLHAGYKRRMSMPDSEQRAYVEQARM